MLGKRRMAAVVAEFLGTGTLTFLVLSIEHSNIGVPLFVGAVAALTIALMTVAFANITEAHFNPAVTLAMWSVQKISTLAGILYIGFQLLGGWLAYYLYTYFANTHLQPIGGHFTGRIFVGETIGAAVLVVGYLAAVYRKLNTGTAASFYGLAYLVGVVAASTVSLALLNPAIALGARAWVWGTYVAGPVVGAVVMANVYSAIFADEPSGLVPVWLNNMYKMSAKASKATAKKK